MSTWFAGKLMLGWEVEQCESRHYVSYEDASDDEAGIPYEVCKAVKRIAEPLSPRHTSPIEYKSSYTDYGFNFIGVPLYDEDESDSIDEFASRMSARVDDLTRAAYEIYEAYMGEPAKEPPTVMLFGKEA